MNSDTAKLLTVVICTYNGARNIKKVVEAVLGQEEFDDYVQSVIVVDNKSSDNTKETVEQIASTAPVVEYQYEENQGLAFARRHAVEVDSPWVAFLDDDNVVMPGWLTAIVTTVAEHPRAGIVNGAVIAKPNVDCTVAQREMLQVLYRDLACTHLTYEDSCNDKSTRGPVGAGMCVATEALRKIDAEGWLHLVGRQGGRLSSGEDGELAEKVQRHGYQFVFNPAAKLYHVIPSARLTDEYAHKLLSGLVDGSYNYISMKPFYVMQRTLRAVKYCGQILLCWPRFWFAKERVQRLRCEYLIETRREFIAMVWRDRIVRRHE